MSGYRAELVKRGGPGGKNDREFLRWFDLIGVQRHIKVLGIFARLWYRDGKSGYLKDLPLTLEYVRDTCTRYPELAGLSRIVDQLFSAAAASANARRAERRLDESDGARRRARRTDAADYRQDPEAARAGRRQAAHRLSPRGAGPGRGGGYRHQPGVSRSPDP